MKQLRKWSLLVCGMLLALEQSARIISERKPAGIGTGAYAVQRYAHSECYPIVSGGSDFPEFVRRCTLPSRTELAICKVYRNSVRLPISEPILPAIKSMPSRNRGVGGTRIRGRTNRPVSQAYAQFAATRYHIAPMPRRLTVCHYQNTPVHFNETRFIAPCSR